MFVADATRGDGKQFVVHADDPLTAFRDESLACDNALIWLNELVISRRLPSLECAIR